MILAVQPCIRNSESARCGAPDLPPADFCTRKFRKRRRGRPEVMIIGVGSREDYGRKRRGIPTVDVAQDRILLCRARTLRVDSRSASVDRRASRCRIKARCKTRQPHRLGRIGPRTGLHVRRRVSRRVGPCTAGTVDSTGARTVTRARTSRTHAARSSNPGIDNGRGPFTLPRYRAPVTGPCVAARAARANAI